MDISDYRFKLLGQGTGSYIIPSKYHQFIEHFRGSSFGANVLPTCKCGLTIPWQLNASDVAHIEQHTVIDQDSATLLHVLFATYDRYDLDFTKPLEMSPKCPKNM